MWRPDCEFEIYINLHFMSFLKEIEPQPSRILHLGLLVITECQI